MKIQTNKRYKRANFCTSTACDEIIVEALAI